MKGVTIGLIAFGAASPFIQVLAENTQRNAPASRPNVLLIMTDQQSFNTISALSDAYPGAVYSKTPNIDRLVRSGVSFTHAYCANPVSVPSRFALFTGMYGGQFGVRSNSDNPEEGPIRKLQEEKAMGTLFRNAGYETVYAGKVHLPYSGRKPGAASKVAAPDGYGFDIYLTDNHREGLASATAEFLNGKANDKNAGPFIMVASFLNPHDICVEYSANVSDEIPDDPKNPEKSETIRAIRARLAKYTEEEFLNGIAPELPENMGKPEGYPATKCSKKRFLDYPSDYWRQYRWVYSELVSLVDRQIGVILDALDANPELKRNTLVVFTSDHGDMQGAHGTGTKSLPFDECQRVPFIFAGSQVKGPSLNDVPVCNGVDLLPTLCELCGLEIPEGMDGISLASIVRDGVASPEVKSRKCIYSESATFLSVYDGKYKLSCFDRDGGGRLLVDMQSYPGEMKNIAAECPETREELMKLPYREIIDRYYKGRFYLGVANHARLLGQLSTEIADREFGYVTPANDFKQSYVHPVSDVWKWKKSDQYLDHAKKQGQVLRLHCPVSPQCSEWVKEDNRTPEELAGMLEEFMTGLCRRYNGDENILWMDVVNETIAKEEIDDPVFGNVKRGDWFGARVGTGKWENPWTIIGYDEESEIKVPLYIDMAFALSNLYAPDIKQIVNQHGNFEEVVWEKMKKLVEYLRSKGRRVDGVGWQAHIDTGWEKVPGNIERLDRFITWCHQNGLEFHITEMNVWMKGHDPHREDEQAETFAKVVETVLKHSRDGVTSVNFWNVRDEDTANPGLMGTIWRNDGTPRPAYMKIKKVLVDMADTDVNVRDACDVLWRKRCIFTEN